jgi:excisionase family DNA binding protein
MVQIMYRPFICAERPWLTGLRQLAPFGVSGRVTSQKSQDCLMESQSDLLTIQEVADQLRIHPDTVRDLLRSGRLKGIRLGANQSEWRVSQRDLRDFSERGRRQGRQR